MSDEYRFEFQAIGVIHSCFQEKFGTPRQSGLVSSAVAELELLPPYNRLASLQGIESFSHLWIQFVFHRCVREEWQPMVKPPRLGGKEKVGVFASRSPYRPNPIGLSVVELESVSYDQERGRVSLMLRGADMIDGTPVLDIKPYVAYSDLISDTRTGFAPDAPERIAVIFSDRAASFCLDYQQKNVDCLKTLITEVLQLDPRPAYYKERIPNRIYGLKLSDCEVKWRYDEAQKQIVVEEISAK